VLEDVEVDADVVDEFVGVGKIPIVVGGTNGGGGGAESGVGGGLDGGSLDDMF
jgi:hypothetical protein